MKKEIISVLMAGAMACSMGACGGADSGTAASNVAGGDGGDYSALESVELVLADSAAKANLETLADFKRLQIRTMENSNHMAFWTAIGAEPTPLEQAVSEAMEDMRAKLVTIDSQNKQRLQEKRMTMITYEPAFFEEVLALDGVKQLYNQINTDTNGLAKTLQKELEANP